MHNASNSRLGALQRVAAENGVRGQQALGPPCDEVPGQGGHDGGARARVGHQEPHADGRQDKAGEVDASHA